MTTIRFTDDDLSSLRSALEQKMTKKAKESINYFTHKTPPPHAGPLHTRRLDGMMTLYYKLGGHSGHRAYSECLRALEVIQRITR